MRQEILNIILSNDDLERIANGYEVRLNLGRRFTTDTIILKPHFMNNFKNEVMHHKITLRRN